MLAAIAAAASLLGRHPPAPAPFPAPSASAPRSPPRPAGSAELALLAPLADGSDLGGFRVREIRAVHRGRVRLVCAKDRSTVHLDVALAAPDGAPPPATAGRYAIYYSLRDAAPEDGDRLARLLAKILEANAAVPAPEGMAPFIADPDPGKSL